MKKGKLIKWVRKQKPIVKLLLFPFLLALMAFPLTVLIILHILGFRNLGWYFIGWLVHMIYTWFIQPLVLDD